MIASMFIKIWDVLVGQCLRAPKSEDCRLIPCIPLKCTSFPCVYSLFFSVSLSDLANNDVYI